MTYRIEESGNLDFDLLLNELDLIIDGYLPNAISTNTTVIRALIDQGRKEELFELIKNIHADFAGATAKINVNDYRTKYKNIYGEELIRQLAQFIENGIYASNKERFYWGYSTGQNLGAMYSLCQAIDINASEA